ncbi:peptidase inhibitor family I36 [Micromonospora pisi]|uniref:Peptidase inhibitor family I36 n=1 Tax=Micromonospora pisi TaxID=589240 RepID=A0A495JXL4_9ACTN|nr:peptidase inhibitor family I36 protein [Micromonospora pisi]RKR92939.1 peptidase inhibitor family I36 [Micromonospora pisi]
MIKMFKAMVIGLTVVAASLLVAPSSASASLSQCASGQFCAWSNDSFSGDFWGWYVNDSNWGNEGMADDAESLFNDAVSSSSVPDNVMVYLHADWAGYDICVNPGETYDAGMDDNDYSSHQWVHGC